MALADFDPAARVGELIARYADPGLSVARVLCDDHPADRIAYTVVQTDLSARDVSFGDLRERSERIAAALAARGVVPGDRVGTLMGKSADFLAVVIGIHRLGAVHVPLFTAFAAPAIALRLAGSRARVVVCDGPQQPKLDGIGDVTVITTATDAAAGAISLDTLLAAQPPGFPAAALGGAAPLIHIYTSGTTGRPKGVVVPAAALAGFHAYLEFALDLRDDDVFWNAADPGWAYGLYLGILGSLLTGVRAVLYTGGFAVEPTWAILAAQGVTNFAAAPTVYRAMRASSAAIPTKLRLRCLSSAGEPLTPEVGEWTQRALGLPVHDHYGQTECAMMVNNHHHPALSRPLHPGAMGQAMPGWSLTVLNLDDDGPAPHGTVGRLAVDRPASPLAWFTGYHEDPAASAGRFAAGGRYYLTGDVASTEPDGTIRFSARDDDVILMAGYRIGPFEIESVLATHPAVQECAVIAVPDAIRGEVVEAFVVARGEPASEAMLAVELQDWVKTRYAAHAYPRRVHFVEALPKTPSGKVQRFLLRQQRATAGAA